MNKKILKKTVREKEKLLKMKNLYIKILFIATFQLSSAISLNLRLSQNLVLGNGFASDAKSKLDLLFLERLSRSPFAFSPRLASSFIFFSSRICR